MRRLFVLLAVFTACALPAVATADSPPPGSTAQCNDGTYSYSQHHSGTCSHHGGVARWLDGSASGGSPSTPPAPAPAVSRPSNVGTTVLFAKRTRTSGCKLGPNPDRSCSPGAYSTGLTKAVLCEAGFHTTSIRHVPDSEKQAVEAEYGLQVKKYGRALEIDHIVSLELGGSNDIGNLFPEGAYAHPGYRVKDKLENRVHAMVCAGQISLRSAQQEIATDWQALYRSVYGVDPIG